MGPLCFRFAVLRGPCGWDAGTVASCCRHTDDFYGTGVRTVLLMDASARVRTVRSSAVGGREAEDQNEAGAALHEMLLAGRMGRSSTFQGGGYT